MRVAVLGNCHAGVVAQAVRAALSDVPNLDCRYIVSYADCSDSDRAFFDAADRVLVQLTDFKGPKSLARTLDLTSDRVGTFPLLAVNFLYPFAGKAHPLAASRRSRHCPAGYYEATLSDSALINIMEESPNDPVSAVVDRYLSLDYSQMLDLDRLYELNRLQMRRLGEAAGLDLWSRVERIFRDVPMFWSCRHPMGWLMRDLCKHALKQLKLGLTPAVIQSAIDPIIEPFGCAHTPIHPSIVRHFGIEWATPEYRYRYMPEGGFTVREFASRFVQFEHNDELHAAVFNLHSDLAVDEAIESLERARLDYPKSKSADILVHLAVGYWKKGNLEQAIEKVVSALDIDRTQMEWAALLCVLIRQARSISGGA